jgi:hypothetical protein
MPDKALTGVSIATSGTMTIHDRIYLNPVLAATFSAVNTGATTPTVTVGAGNAYVDVVTVIVPNSPVSQAAVETQSYVGDITNSQYTGVTQ